MFSKLAYLPHLKTLATMILELFVASHTLLRPMPFIVGLSIATVSWVCEALAFHLVLEGFGLRFPLLTSFSVYGLSTVIGALSMLPGGIGGVEAAMMLSLMALGVNAASTVAPVVLIRFSTLWLISLFGFVFMGVWWLSIKRGRTKGVLEDDLIW